jgi:hypothetical protein
VCTKRMNISPPAGLHLGLYAFVVVKIASRGRSRSKGSWFRVGSIAAAANLN